MGPSPAFSDTLSELAIRARLFCPSPKTAYTTVSAIKIVQFCIMEL